MAYIIGNIALVRRLNEQREVIANGFPVGSSVNNVEAKLDGGSAA